MRRADSKKIQEQAAEIMERTEDRMHSTAEHLHEPDRSVAHEHAHRVSDMARRRRQSLQETDEPEDAD